MSRPLIPRPSIAGDSEMDSQQACQKPRKISTACGACKQRKTKCTGNTPCEACSSRETPCVYDQSSDQRRKIANQRNIHDLVEAQDNLERHRQLLGGIIAVIRAGGSELESDLLASIRTEVDLSQLAAHVRNARRASPAVEKAFASVEFVIDGPRELPSPMQLLSNMPSNASNHSGVISTTDGIAGSRLGNFFQPPSQMIYQDGY